jgi:hypothetical protein
VDVALNPLRSVESAVGCTEAVVVDVVLAAVVEVAVAIVVLVVVVVEPSALEPGKNMARPPRVATASSVPGSTNRVRNRRRMEARSLAMII